MGKKNKDCVFAIGLLALGLYVVYESWNMLGRAAKPPYRITEFSASPAMLPMVLGCALLVFSAFLLAASIKGGGENALGLHLSTAFKRLGQALVHPDVISMAVSSIIMFIYTFFIIGSVPYRIGSMLFLIALMLYLRASTWWVILLSSGISVALIILLFQNVFKTTLP